MTPMGSHPADKPKLVRKYNKACRKSREQKAISLAEKILAARRSWDIMNRGSLLATM